MTESAKDRIERELEQDRLALAQSLEALRDRLRPASLVAEGKNAFVAQTAPMLSRLDGVVRAHPMLTVVAGVALAAVIFGRSRPADSEAAPTLAGTTFEALTRWEDEGGSPAPGPMTPDEDWLNEMQTLHERAQTLLRQIDEATRRKLAPVAQLAKHRAEILSALTAETKVALGKGLDALDSDARQQALQARERAYLARIALADKSRQAEDENPLAMGAALALAGVAMAWLFPRTETEDRLLGEASDQLVADLKAMARQEAVKTSAFASTLSEALKTDMQNASHLFTPDKPMVRPVRP